ncbi:MAG: hypothetical protein HZB57_02475 [Gammaproteobacteria bacterium]|nr:hypothetical protein [Gammaproteobacteria bacterium]
MTERSFRLLIGVWLVLALLAGQPVASYVLMGVLLFEAITNWRVPILLARFSRTATAVAEPAATAPGECLIPFEAERAFRLIIAASIGLPMYLAPELLWWLPWFVAFALIGAGLSGMCPMVLALRWVGMR